MKYVIVSVRDMAAECFSTPQFVAARGQALRGFIDQVNSAESGVVHLHPEHFVLYALGTYDDSNGKFETHDPEQLALGSDVIREAVDIPHKLKAVQ